MILTLVLILASCESNEEYHNIAAKNNVYSMGTQSVLIEASSLGTDQPTVSFKPGISTSDIVLGKALEGKSVSKVTYKSETSITLELSGDTKVAGGADVLGTITIKHSGLNSKGSSTCLVNVLAPKLQFTAMVSNKSVKDGVSAYKIVATLGLTLGEFTDRATAENIKLADGAEGKLSVALSDGNLTLTVEDCNVANPHVTFGAEVTTIGKQVTCELSLTGSAEFQ